MSAKRAPQETDPERERDPHGIVPDSFWELYDSIEEARRNAENATDDDARKRCPADGCASVHITPRSSKPTSQTEHAWRCKRCGHRFDTPRASVDEEIGEQATLGEAVR